MNNKLLENYKIKLKKENRVFSYWDTAFKNNPEKYMKDVPDKRFVSYADRKKIRKNRLCSDENFIYSDGNFDRVMRWRGIPIYKNAYDYALYPSILTTVSSEL